MRRSTCLRATVHRLAGPIEAGGQNRAWIEIPAAGKSGDDYEMPAPGIKLLPKR